MPGDLHAFKMPVGSLLPDPLNAGQISVASSIHNTFRYSPPEHSKIIITITKM